MPNRVIREGILTSEKVDRLSEPAEVFYRRLMSVADDFGRFVAHATLLRSACYPLRIDSKTNEEVEEHLAECAASGLVAVYKCNGKRYLELSDFRQRARADASKYPAPDSPTATECAPGVNQVTDTGLSHDRQVTARARGHARGRSAEAIGEGEGERRTTSRKVEVDRDALIIPQTLETPEFRTALNDFIDHRKTLKPPLTQKAAELTIMQCERMGLSKALASIDEAIRKGWKGLYEREWKNGESPPVVEKKQEFKQAVVDEMPIIPPEKEAELKQALFAIRECGSLENRTIHNGNCNVHEA